MNSDSKYAVVLKPRRAMPFFARHPWVFAGSINRITKDTVAIAHEEVPVGTTVDLYSANEEFIARGLFNANSNIRLRLYSWNKDEELDPEFWKNRISDAIALRSGLLGSTKTNAKRLVFSEADGISGLTVDQYDEWLLVQFTSLALQQQSSAIVELLNQQLSPKGIVHKTDPGIAELEGMESTDDLLSGESPPTPILIHENGIQFGVDVKAGQKTGFFLDQRDNRQAVAKYVEGHDVLDLFCYTGGFSLAATKNGNAKSALGVDSSEMALATAKANAELNEVGNKCQFMKSDASTALDQFAADGRLFDTVVVDPPKLARKRSGLDRAMRAYFNLNRKAVDCLKPGGLLVTCSCSGLVGRDDFEEMLSAVAQSCGRDVQILESKSAAADHPFLITCSESNYLKCYICRVL